MSLQHRGRPLASYLVLFVVLQTVGSYTPIFLFASVAYLFALLVVHLIVPTYAPAKGFTAES